MERGSTIFLRGVVLLLGVAVVALYGVLTFGLPSEGEIEITPIYFVLYAMAIPFFAALYQTLKLLGYIDKNKAFSELSVKALKYIKYCAVTISILFTACMPSVYFIAEEEDAPGLILIGMTFTFAPVVIAVFAAVLQKLLRNAIDIKKENDLTV